jgi:hypothetical protein
MQYGTAQLERRGMVFIPELEVFFVCSAIVFKAFQRGPTKYFVQKTNWKGIFSESRIFYFSVNETDTTTSGLRWIFHMHSEFSRPTMCNNAIMIISSQM